MKCSKITQFKISLKTLSRIANMKTVKHKVPNPFSYPKKKLSDTKIQRLD